MNDQPLVVLVLLLELFSVEKPRCSEEAGLGAWAELCTGGTAELGAFSSARTNQQLLLAGKAAAWRRLRCLWLPGGC